MKNIPKSFQMIFGDLKVNNKYLSSFTDLSPYFLLLFFSEPFSCFQEFTVVKMLICGYQGQSFYFLLSVPVDLSSWEADEQHQQVQEHRMKGEFMKVVLPKQCQQRETLLHVMIPKECVYELKEITADLINEDTVAE